LPILIDDLAVQLVGKINCCQPLPDSFHQYRDPEIADGRSVQLPHRADEIGRIALIRRARLHRGDVNTGRHARAMQPDLRIEIAPDHSGLGWNGCDQTPVAAGQKHSVDSRMGKISLLDPLLTFEAWKW